MTSPAYVFHVTGAMKALLDHFAYRWMPHRPAPEMFGKRAVIITQCLGSGAKSAAKDIKHSLSWWGISKIEIFTGALMSDIVWEKYGIEGSGIFNGDIGIIEDIDIEGEALIIRFDDREVKYPFELLDELELSYAITVHKSQGSEYPFVVMPLSSCAPMLMTRNLFYTAVTRARKMVVLVGRMDIAAKMVENNREVMRYTTLESRLRRADN